MAAVRGVLAGDLRMGAIQSLGDVDLGTLLGNYHRAFPGVHVTIRNAGVRALVRQVVDGELDLAFVDRPLGPDERRVDVHRLGEDRLVLAVAVSSPLSRRKRVRLATLSAHQFVEYRKDSALRAHIDDVCDAVGLQRTSSAEIDTVPGMLELVAHEVGIAVLPEHTLRLAPPGRVVAIQMDPPITREIVLVAAADRPPSPAAAAMMEMVPSVAPGA